MGISERRQQERQERRASIVEAAKAVFLEKGIEHTTMKDIADRAELSKAALYIYFKNKEELTFELLHTSFQLVQDLIDQAAAEGTDGYHKLELIARSFLEMFDQQAEYIYFSLIMEQYSYSISRQLPTTQKCLALLTDIQQSIVALLNEGIRDGSIRRDLEAEKSAVLFLHMAISFMQRISLMRGVFDPERTYKTAELVEQMFNIFLHSLK